MQLDNIYLPLITCTILFVIHASRLVKIPNLFLYVVCSQFKFDNLYFHETSLLHNENKKAYL